MLVQIGSVSVNHAAEIANVIVRRIAVLVRPGFLRLVGTAFRGWQRCHWLQFGR